LTTVKTLQKPYTVVLTAIPMGKAGMFARILATRLGFRLQYFPFNMAAQYGQLDITYVRSVFEIHHQTTRSQVFGLIGHPTNHSEEVFLQAVQDAAAFAKK
jgi:hypothetical protein